MEESGADGEGRARGRGGCGGRGRCQGGRSRGGVGSGIVVVEGSERGEKGFGAGGAGSGTAAEDVGGGAVTGVDEVVCRRMGGGV
jgi:hypothetical protein